MNTVLEATYPCPVPHIAYKAILLAQMSHIWSRNVSTFFLTGNISSKQRTWTEYTCKTRKMFIMCEIWWTEICRTNMLYHNNHKAFQFSMLIWLYSHGVANSEVVQYHMTYTILINNYRSIGRDLAETGNSSFLITTLRTTKIRCNIWSCNYIYFT
jgi:hypothetical protein